MAQTKTYDPAKNLFSFAGNLIGGYAPDTFIEVERNEDGFTLAVGATGEATRVRNNNTSGTITITLLSSSQSNDVLNAIAAADELSGTGVGVAHLKELNGTTRALAQNAWVKKLPKIERGKEAPTTVWVFECASLELAIGGLL